MKKFLITFVSALLLFGLLVPCAVMAEMDNFIDGIGEINCPKATPTIDGSVVEGEGWSGAQYFDKTNTDGAWGGQEVRWSGNLYRAYDDTNLYIAAEINVPEVIISTSEDYRDLPHERGNQPGWDGDTFILSLDPLYVLLDEGMANDPAPWYIFGIFEGNVIRTYRANVNDGEITDLVKAAGELTDYGWKLEVAIPWEVICKDVTDICFGFYELTPEEILKDGNVITMSMIYYDRGYNEEMEDIVTYSRYVSIAKTLPDGSSGTLSSAWILQAHGIFLKLEDNSAGEEGGNDNNNENNNGSTNGNTNTNSNGQAQNGSDTTASGTPSDSKNPSNGSSNNSSGKSTGGKGSTTKAQGTSSATGGVAAQTFDIGIAVALGALAVSGVGVYKSRKR